MKRSFTTPDDHSELKARRTKHALTQKKSYDRKKELLEALFAEIGIDSTSHQSNEAMKLQDAINAVRGLHDALTAKNSEISALSAMLASSSPVYSAADPVVAAADPVVAAAPSAIATAEPPPAAINADFFQLLDFAQYFAGEEEDDFIGLLPDDSNDAVSIHHSSFFSPHRSPEPVTDFTPPLPTSKGDSTKPS